MIPWLSPNISTGATPVRTTRAMYTDYVGEAGLRYWPLRTDRPTSVPAIPPWNSSQDTKHVKEFQGTIMVESGVVEASVVCRASLVAC